MQLRFVMISGFQLRVELTDNICSKCKDTRQDIHVVVLIDRLYYRSFVSASGKIDTMHEEKNLY